MGLSTFDTERILFKAYFESQYKYCPFIWMFCSRQLIIELINYRSEPSDLFIMITIPLLWKCPSHKYSNAVTRYKIKYNLSESCLKDLFNVVNGNYNLRSQSDFGVTDVNTGFTVPIPLGILDHWHGVVFQII